MTKHTDVPPWFYTQSAVIPYRQDSGGLQVLLITTIKRKRWIIPKGVVDPGLTPQESAMKEASEEAGVSGRITGNGPAGTYRYDKWGGTCTVTVFPMLVTEFHDDWPESGQRERRWVSISEACDFIENEAICSLINSFADEFQSGSHKGA